MSFAHGVVARSEQTSFDLPTRRLEAHPPLEMTASTKNKAQ